MMVLLNWAIAQSLPMLVVSQVVKVCAMTSVLIRMMRRALSPPVILSTRNHCRRMSRATTRHAYLTDRGVLTASLPDGITRRTSWGHQLPDRFPFLSSTTHSSGMRTPRTCLQLLLVTATVHVLKLPLFVIRRGRAIKSPSTDSVNFSNQSVRRMWLSILTRRGPLSVSCTKCSGCLSRKEIHTLVPRTMQALKINRRAISIQLSCREIRATSRGSCTDLQIRH